MKLFLSDTEVPEQNSLAEILGSNDLTQHHKAGSGNDRTGQTNIPSLVVSMVAADAIEARITGVSQDTIAKVYDLDHATVSNFSNGKKGGKINEDLKAEVEARKLGITDIATAKLMQSLDLFSPETLEQKDLPRAATAMAGVLDKINGNSNKDQNGNVHLHFYAPRQKDEKSYDVIEVD